MRILNLLMATLNALPGLTKSRRSLLLARAGSSRAIVEHLDAGLATVDEAIALAEESGDPAAVADGAMVRGSLQYQFARINDTIRDMGRARPLAEALNRRWELATILSFLGRSLSVAGRLDESRRISEEARQVAENVGHIGGASLGALDLTHQDWIRTGNLEAFEKAVEFLLPMQAPAVVRENAVWARAAARFERNVDPDPARDLVGSEDRVTITQWRDMMWMVRMGIDAYCVPDRARDTWRLYGERIPRDDRPMFAGQRSVLNHLVEALAVLGEDADAASLYIPVKAAMDDGHVLLPDGVVEMAAAIAAACAARWDVAESHFTSALATAERLPHVVAQVEVRRWHAWMLRRRSGSNDSVRAERLVRDALALAERHHLPRRIGLCRAALQSA